MKLKEIPASLYQTLKVRVLPLKKILDTNRPYVPLTVTLTSIPSRLNKVHLTIRSILNQTQRPQKIVLWLHESLKESLPRSLQILEGDIFEIRYTHLHCSHKKLVTSKKEFPDAILLTSDDDFIYPKNWIASIYREHLKYPKVIIANQVRTISYHENGILKPYKQWIYDSKTDSNSKYVLPIGAKGVLYPPNVFVDTVFDEDLFLKLTPKADDLWFKAMSMLKGTPSRLSENPIGELVPIMGTQAISLKRDNIGKDKNVSQWKALDAYFKLRE